MTKRTTLQRGVNGGLSKAVEPKKQSIVTGPHRNWAR